jgi:GNAT superfamily N-acetyltransferase
MKELTFREATLADTIAIGKIAREIWCKWYITIISQAQIDYMLARGYSPESLAKQMNEGNYKFSLAYMGEELVGYAAMHTTDGKDYFLDKFYIDTEKHQQGIGGKFLAYLEGIYTPEILRLRVNRKNYVAINFYFKNGFTIERTDELSIGEGYEMNDFIMVKK